MKNELIKRKPNRLKDFDYSANGAYFVTICTKDKKCILSKIVGAIQEICFKGVRVLNLAKEFLRPHNT